MKQSFHPSEPASQIAVTIIREAIAKHADQIRIGRGQSLCVEYIIEDQSELGMRLPNHIADELFDWFKSKTQNGEMLYAFPPDAPYYYFEMQLDATETIMTLFVSKVSRPST